MVTGDNVITARSVAVNCGIIRPDEENVIYDGEEFNSYIRDPDKKVSRRALPQIDRCVCKPELCQWCNRGFIRSWQPVNSTSYFPGYCHLLYVDKLL